jgi:DNA-binding Lrp family transcriptional regulator
MKELWGSPAVWNKKKTYVDIARKLGVDEETVRNRIKHLKENGFLLGWRLFPNPALLGRIPVFLFLEFEDEDAKEVAIPDIAKMDGVTVISSFYGKNVLVSLYDDEQKDSAKKISKAGIRAQTLTTPGISMPAPLQVKVTEMDWKIVYVMLRDAEKDATEVARELKASTRTINRRLNSLMEARAIFITPLVDLKTGGGVSYQLLVHTEEGRRSEIDQLVSSKIDNLVFKAGMPPSGLIFGFNGQNIAEGTELLKWVKKVKGVKSAKMNIVENVVHVFDWLEKEVKARAFTS